MKALDARAERSKAALLQAFVQLIFRDGFQAISVQSIVAAAGTARSTFYEHFSSKEDILRASMSHFFGVMADCVSSDRQPVELTWVLTHFWQNRRMTDAVFTGIPRRILARSLSEAIEARLQTGSLALPASLAATQLAEAQLAVVEAWLRGRAFCRAEDMAAALYRTTRASIAALDKAGN